MEGFGLIQWQGQTMRSIGSPEALGKVPIWEVGERIEPTVPITTPLYYKYISMYLPNTTYRQI